MAVNGSNSTQPRSNWIAVGATVVVCFAFMVFVLTYDDLKQDDFTQRLTGIVLTIAVAVILFSVVPSSAQLTKTGIALGGAAAFWILALPRVSEFLFPWHTITGYIYYRSSHKPQEGLRPVEGVVVQVRNTGQKSQPTDEHGRFVIDSVPRAVGDLTVSYNGLDYAIMPKEHPDRRYPVIPRNHEETSNPVTIGTQDWSEDGGDQCLPESQRRYVRLKRCLLQKTIPKLTGYETLHVQILLGGDGTFEIADAHRLEPANGVGVQEKDESHARQWEFPITGDDLRVRLLVCLGTKQTGRTPTDECPVAHYWFSRVVTE